MSESAQRFSGVVDLGGHSPRVLFLAWWAKGTLAMLDERLGIYLEALDG